MFDRIFFKNRRLEGLVSKTCITYHFSRWWFQIRFIVTPIWRRFPFWLIYFCKWLGWNHQLVLHWISRKMTNLRKLTQKKAKTPYCILGLWDRFGTFFGIKNKVVLPSKLGKFYVGCIFAKDLTIPMVRDSHTPINKGWCTHQKDSLLN